ncbi:hypothetical protein DTO217A2_285 [Paecilomyces variotii]|nr:hypothetical protein DTO217A2_285 [Paecilomyces variotii]
MLAGHVGLAIAGILFSRYLQHINATRFHIGRSVETKALAAASIIPSLKPMSQICSSLLDMQSPSLRPESELMRKRTDQIILSLGGLFG